MPKVHCLSIKMRVCLFSMEGATRIPGWAKANKILGWARPTWSPHSYAYVNVASLEKEI